MKHGLNTDQAEGQFESWTPQPMYCVVQRSLNRLAGCGLQRVSTAVFDFDVEEI